MNHNVPAIYASQRVWLDWIAYRFNGVAIKHRYQRLEFLVTVRPLDAYQSDPNWSIKTADAPYEMI